MNGFGYTNYNMPTASAGMGAFIWAIVALVISLAGCFIIYFLFVKKEDKDLKGFLAWLKDFLRFDKMLIEPILKISYIFGALYITLSSFSLIGTSFVAFLGLLIGGNLGLRVLYEAFLMGVMIWKNTTEINKKLK